MPIEPDIRMQDILSALEFVLKQEPPEPKIPAPEEKKPPLRGRKKPGSKYRERIIVDPGHPQDPSQPPKYRYVYQKPGAETVRWNLPEEYKEGLKSPEAKAGIKVIDALKKAGHESYLVGGAVRDLLLGKSPKDYDVVTSARPDQVKKVFPKVYEVGEQFAITPVVMDDEWVEIATYRTETGYSDKRRPDEIKFADTLEDDAKRRDFTINGLYLDPVEGKVVDAVDGVRDIKNKTIRTIGSPQDRFNEDALRLMRAVRFAATLGFDIDEGTIAAIKKMAGNIKEISNERIRDELVKTITKGGAAQGVRLLDELGLLEHILPEVHELHGVEQSEKYHPEGDAFEHTVKVLEGLDKMEKPSKTLALAALLHDIGKKADTRVEDGKIISHGHDETGAKMAEEVAKRLKLTKEEREQVVALVRDHMVMHFRFRDMKPKNRRKWMMKPHFAELLELGRLDKLGGSGDLSEYDEAKKLFEQFREEQEKYQKPLMQGRDLIDMGFKAGKYFGPILEEVRDLQLEGKITTLEEAKKYVASKYSPEKSWESPVQKAQTKAAWFFPLPKDGVKIPKGKHPGAFGVSRKGDRHRGVDLYAPEGSPVFAVEAGVVVDVFDVPAPEDAPSGKVTEGVSIQGVSGRVTYAEMKRDEHLRVGSEVHQGQLLGKVVPIHEEESDIPPCMLHIQLATSGPVEEWTDKKPENLLDPTSHLVESLKRTEGYTWENPEEDILLAVSQLLKKEHDPEDWNYTVEKGLFWQRKDGKLYTHADPYDIGTPVVEYNPSSHTHREALKKGLLQRLHKQFPKLSREQLESALHISIAATGSKEKPGTASPMYAPWLAQQTNNALKNKPNSVRLPEDAPDVFAALKIFHRLSRSPDFDGEKDINKYPDFKALKEVVQGVTGEIQPSKAQRVKAAKMDGAKVVHTSGDREVIEVTTPEAVVSIAQGTQWCVRFPRYAKSYLKNGPLYVITNSEGEKICAYHEHGSDEYPGTQFVDLNDDTVQIIDENVAELLESQDLPIPDNVEVMSLDDALESPERAYTYASEARKMRTPEVEDVIREDPDIAEEYAVQFLVPPGHTREYLADAAVEELASFNYDPESWNQEVISREEAKTDPVKAVDYALTSRRYGDAELEEVIAQDFASSLDYALNLPHKQRAPDVVENKLAEKATYGIPYAEHLGPGRRFKKGEATFAESPAASVEYAEHLGKGRRFEVGEKSIARNAKMSLKYAEHLGKRFEAGEKVIVEDPQTALEYVERVVGGPFPEAEEIFLKHPMHGAAYVRVSGEPFPALEDKILSLLVPVDHIPDEVRQVSSIGEYDLRRDQPGTAVAQLRSELARRGLEDQVSDEDVKALVSHEYGELLSRSYLSNLDRAGLVNEEYDNFLGRLRQAQGREEKSWEDPEQDILLAVEHFLQEEEDDDWNFTVEKGIYWRRSDGSLWTHEDPYDPSTKVVPYKPAKHEGREEISQKKIDKLKKKFPSLSDEQIEAAIHISIAATGAKDTDKKGTAEYVGWLAKQANAFNMKGAEAGGLNLPEDVHSAIEALAQFHELRNNDLYQGKKDIGNYKTYAQLAQDLRTAVGRKEENNEVQLDGAKVVQSTGDHELVEVTDVNTLTALAKGTKWCVQFSDYASQYLAGGPIYLITEGKKRLFLYSPSKNEFMNPDDVRPSHIDTEMKEMLEAQGVDVPEDIEVISMEDAKKDPETAILMASQVKQRRVPELEDMIKQSPNSAEYAMEVVVRPAESINSKLGYLSEDRAKLLAEFGVDAEKDLGKKPISEAEAKGSPEKAAAFLLSEGKRDAGLESVVGRSKTTSWQYLQGLPKGSRFKPLEKMLLKGGNVKDITRYADERGKRFVEGEKLIASQLTEALDKYKDRMHEDPQAVYNAYEEGLSLVSDYNEACRYDQNLVEEAYMESIPEHASYALIELIADHANRREKSDRAPRKALLRLARAGGHEERRQVLSDALIKLQTREHYTEEGSYLDSKGRDPVIEEHLIALRSPESLATYSDNVIRGRFKEAEEAIKEDPDVAAGYARRHLFTTNDKGGGYISDKRLKELLPFGFHTVPTGEEDEFELRYPAGGAATKGKKLLTREDALSSPEKAQYYISSSKDLDDKEMVNTLFKDPMQTTLLAAGLHQDKKEIPQSFKENIGSNKSAAKMFVAFGLEAGKPFPEGEKVLSESPLGSVAYAEHLGRKKRFEAGEPAIATDASASMRYANHIGGRFPAGEKAMAEAANESKSKARGVVDYARWQMQGRFKEAEEGIAKHPKAAQVYLDTVVPKGERFKAAEKLFSGDRQSALRYAKHLGNGVRFKEGERALAEDAHTAISYAMHLGKGKKFEAGEKAIAEGDASTGLAYARHLGRPFPPVEQKLIPKTALEVEYRGPQPIEYVQDTKTRFGLFEEHIKDGLASGVENPVPDHKFGHSASLDRETRSRLGWRMKREISSLMHAAEIAGHKLDEETAKRIVDKEYAKAQAKAYINALKKVDADVAGAAAKIGYKPPETEDKSWEDPEQDIMTGLEWVLKFRERITQIDPPDPAGVRGKKRGSFRLTLTSGKRDYVDKLPDGARPGALYDPDKQKVVAEKKPDPAALWKKEGVKSPYFKRWFGDWEKDPENSSKVVDEDGKPLVVFHGTTNIFDAFNTEVGNPENDFGRGAYFTNTKDDVNTNYAGEGPDLSQRIMMLAERMMAEDEDLDEKDARKKAKKKLSKHAGAVIPAYLNLRKPLVLGGKDETFLDYEYGPDEDDVERFMEDAKEQLIEEYDVETDEDPDDYFDEDEVKERARNIAMDHGYYTESGALNDFLHTLERVSMKYDEVDIPQMISDVREASQGEGMSAKDVIHLLRRSSGLMYATDEEGNLVSTEIIREALERMGFDGVIDHTVWEKFGSGREMGKPMEGVTEDTVHYIAFQPNQIKSAIGNKGTFDPDDPKMVKDILLGLDWFLRSKERITQIDMPDPTGLRGRERQSIRLTLASGERQYVDKLPEGTKPGHIFDTDTGKVSVPKAPWQMSRSEFTGVKDEEAFSAQYLDDEWRKKHDPEWKRYDDFRRKRRAWNRSVLGAVSAGKLPKEKAVDAEVSDAVDLKPIPEGKLYHTTVNLRALTESGKIYPKDILLEEKRGFEGLGGGESEAVSLTSDKKYAVSIARGLRQLQKLVRGDVSMPDFLDAADKVRPGISDEVLDHLAGSHGVKPNALKEAVRENRLPERKPTLFDPEPKQIDPKEFRFDLFKAINTFIGGEDYIAVWGYTPELENADIGIVEAEPVRGAHGKYFPAESEWRVYSEDATKIRGVLDPSEWDPERQKDKEASVFEDIMVAVCWILKDKQRITQIDMPDPTGLRGRERESIRITLASGKRQYVDHLPAGTKPGHLFDTKTGKVSAPKAQPKLITFAEAPSGAKFRFLHVKNDAFVHFTTSERAKQILESGKLLMSPPYKKFGTDTVDAVSLTYGESVPGVQTTHIKGKDLVAVKFRTKTKPRYGYQEETKWDQDVDLIGPEIISAKDAVKAINQSPHKIGEMDQVIYDKDKAKQIKESYARKPAKIDWGPIDESLGSGQVIAALKQYRASTGASLKESLERVRERQKELELQPKESTLESKYPKISNGKSDGRTVREEIPNLDSISASLENYEEVPGIRDIPLSEFDLTGRAYDKYGTDRIKKLAEAIKESGEINPLIVVMDDEGLYILEGGHRAEALHRLGAKSLPAKLVVDTDSVELSEGEGKTKDKTKEAEELWKKEGVKSPMKELYERLGTDDHKKINEMSDEEFVSAVPETKDSYIAFYPEQIKSAEDNEGTFDPDDPNITKDILAAVEWLLKDRITNIDPPDPTGQRGRKRDSFRITVSSGKRYYLDELPSGTKPGHLYDPDTGKVTQPPVQPGAKRPLKSGELRWKKPDLSEESGEYFENEHTQREFAKRGLEFKDEEELTDFMEEHGKRAKITQGELAKNPANLTLDPKDFKEELESDPDYARSYQDMKEGMEKKGVRLPAPIVFKFGDEYYGFAGNRRMNLAFQNDKDLEVHLVEVPEKLLRTDESGYTDFYRPKPDPEAGDPDGIIDDSMKKLYASIKGIARARRGEDEKEMADASNKFIDEMEDLSRKLKEKEHPMAELVDEVLDAIDRLSQNEQNVERFAYGLIREIWGSEPGMTMRGDAGMYVGKCLEAFLLKMLKKLGELEKVWEIETGVEWLLKYRERIAQIDMPDPTGLRGRERQSIRLTLTSGKRQYVDKLPEGTKPGHFFDTRTGKISSPKSMTIQVPKGATPRQIAAIARKALKGTIPKQRLNRLRELGESGSVLDVLNAVGKYANVALKEEKKPQEEVRTGKPWKGTVYRGQTRAGESGAAHGIGKYYGLTQDVAELFSKPGTVEEHKIQLSNPAVVRSDKDLKNLKMKAEADTGRDFGKKGNLYEMLRPDQAKAFTNWMTSQGYDGMIIDYPEAAGGRQAVVFPLQKKEEKAPEKMTYEEARSTLENIRTKDDLKKAEPLLRRFFPEWTETEKPDPSNDFAYGIWRMANKQDEIHRIPFSDFSKRYERAKEKQAQELWNKEGTKSPHFKNWFGDWEKDPENASKVVDAEGKPQRVFHGTKEVFSEFDRGHLDEYMLDRLLGFHFAVDPAIASTFAGEESTTHREERTGSVMPLYLNIRNPKEVKVNGSDQAAINEEIIENAFRQEGAEDLFTKWAQKRLMIDEGKAKKILGLLREGKPVPKEYGLASAKATSVGEYIANFDSGLIMLPTEDKKVVVDRALEELQRQGYDGIVYENTSPMETREAKDRTTYIAFRPEQMKSATGNKGTFDPEQKDIRKERTSSLEEEVLEGLEYLLLEEGDDWDFFVEKGLFWQRKDGTIWTHENPYDPSTKIVPYDPEKLLKAKKKKKKKIKIVPPERAGSDLSVHGTTINIMPLMDSEAGDG